MLRNPKGEFKLVDLPDLMGAYSDAIVTDYNGMIMDMSEVEEVKRDINRKQGKAARMEAEEIEMRKDETAESFVAGIFKNADRSFFKNVDTSIVDAPTKASQGQFSRRRRERETRDTIADGIEEYKNEE